ncbi:MAG: hypothetical protein CVU39_05935 [Chloroflexi bacterium HGW-Chloroflexi-10]|nr:MAG: hypothetical protein CVU39_05935 [Chloroflexi bacterium HGW-Chloroflexi-10]
MLSAIFNLLTETPASFIYHITIALMLLTTIQLIGWRSPAKNSRRILIALGLILGIQVIGFVLNGLAWQGLPFIPQIVPVFDRFFLVFSVMWISWIWIFPESTQKMEWGFIGINILVLVTLVTTTYFWINSNFSAFNFSWMDYVWELLFGFVVLVSMILLLIRKKENWEFGLLFLIIQLLGIVGHFLFSELNQSLSGAYRLAQVIAFPLIPSLARSFEVQKAIGIKEFPSSMHDFKQNFEVDVERRRFSADPRTVNIWLALAAQQNPEAIGVELSHAIAQSMLVDLCLLTNAPDQYGQISILCGYDLLRDEAISGETLPADKVNLLTTAINKGKPFWFSPQNAALSTDVLSIQKAIKLEKLDNVLVVPLKHQKKTIGSLLFLSPYGNREWNDDDMMYITGNTSAIASILASAYDRSNRDLGENDLSTQLSDAEQEIKKLQNEKAVLEEKTNTLVSSLEESYAPNNQLEQLIRLNEESQATIEILQGELSHLQGQLLQTEELSSQKNDESYNRIEEELRLMLEETARLQNDLAEARAKIYTYEQVNNQAIGMNEEDREVIASIVQELRQPMSSILGYTDLLLGESVGVLGQLQRKFLERIKASNERMRSLLDDIVHFTANDPEQLELKPQSVDLGELIDNAIKDTSAQLQEKDISLHLDLPDQMPHVFVDKEAFQQVLVHLLQNAGNASPNEGEIILQIDLQENEYNEEYILINIGDTGGGIPKEEINKVFSPRYKADMPLIQGLGDTGVGLSIAKSLVEAHGGRIWVETEENKGTQFSVMMPLMKEVND